ncbi:MAG TPA: hypothetical protein VFE46_19400 [Pirellulales bacterium]|jgi:hypothetical protein|nr:hypothetical protein [Pirellulales bacterium]
MSDRERWIVYPLLFLALGLSLRNELIIQDAQQDRSVELDQVRCKGLQIMGPDGKAKITLGTDQEGDGLLETGPEDNPLIKIGANSSGAELSLYDADHKKFLMLGFNGQIAGLLAGLVGQREFYPMSIVPISRTPRTEEKSKPSDKAKSAQPKSADQSGGEETPPDSAQPQGSGH